MSKTDPELLREYTEGSQEAFNELVRRHLDLVYSAARRQTPSVQMAEDVTQSVFVNLARSARKVNPATPLAAWLHLATRHIAINAARDESRRRTREQTAFELSAMNASPSVWSHVEPLLDEAVAALPEADRSAIVLRYFENKSLREVGAALGASEDAAQKRVTRAVEQLRAFFAKRGIAVSSTGLVLSLATNATQAAPANLGAAISVAVGAGALTPVITHTATVLTMSMIQKTVGAGILFLLGTGLFVVSSLGEQRAQVLALEKEVASLSRDEFADRQARDDALRRFAMLQEAGARVSSPAPAASSNPGDPVIGEILARVSQLKQKFENEPARKIPELALLTEANWQSIARERALGTEEELRASLGRARSIAKGTLASQLIAALQTYVVSHGGNLPDSPHELQLAFTPAIEPAVLNAILARYSVKTTGSAARLPDRTILLEENEATLVDPDYDMQLQISSGPSTSRPNPNTARGDFNTAWIPGALVGPPPQFVR